MLALLEEEDIEVPKSGNGAITTDTGATWGVTNDDPFERIAEWENRFGVGQ